MKRPFLITRLLALWLSLCLALPSPAFSLRQQAQPETSGLEELDEALTNSESSGLEEDEAGVEMQAIKDWATKNLSHLGRMSDGEAKELAADPSNKGIISFLEGRQGGGRLSKRMRTRVEEELGPSLREIAKGKQVKPSEAPSQGLSAPGQKKFYEWATTGLRRPLFDLIRSKGEKLAGLRQAGEVLPEDLRPGWSDLMDRMAQWLPGRFPDDPSRLQVGDAMEVLEWLNDEWFSKRGILILPMGSQGESLLDFLGRLCVAEIERQARLVLPDGEDRWSVPVYHVRFPQGDKGMTNPAFMMGNAVVVRLDRFGELAKTPWNVLRERRNTHAELLLGNLRPSVYEARAAVYEVLRNRYHSPEAYEPFLIRSAVYEEVRHVWDRHRFYKARGERCCPVVPPAHLKDFARFMVPEGNPLRGMADGAPPELGENIGETIGYGFFELSGEMTRAALSEDPTPVIANWLRQIRLKDISGSRDWVEEGNFLTGLFGIWLLARELGYTNIEIGPQNFLSDGFIDSMADVAREKLIHESPRNSRPALAKAYRKIFGRPVDEAPLSSLVAALAAVAPGSVRAGLEEGVVHEFLEQARKVLGENNPESALETLVKQRIFGAVAAFAAAASAGSNQWTDHELALLAKVILRSPIFDAEMWGFNLAREMVEGSWGEKMITPVPALLADVDQLENAMGFVRTSVTSQEFPDSYMALAEKGFLPESINLVYLGMRALEVLVEATDARKTVQEQLRLWRDAAESTLIYWQRKYQYKPVGLDIREVHTGLEPEDTFVWELLDAQPGTFREKQWFFQMPRGVIREYVSLDGLLVVQSNGADFVLGLVGDKDKKVQIQESYDGDRMLRVLDIKWDKVKAEVELAPGIDPRKPVVVGIRHSSPQSRLTLVLNLNIVPPEEIEQANKALGSIPVKARTPQGEEKQLSLALVGGSPPDWAVEGAGLEEVSAEEVIREIDELLRGLFESGSQIQLKIGTRRSYWRRADRAESERKGQSLRAKMSVLASRADPRAEVEVLIVLDFLRGAAGDSTAIRKPNLRKISQALSAHLQGYEFRAVGVTSGRSSTWRRLGPSSYNIRHHSLKFRLASTADADLRVEIKGPGIQVSGSPASVGVGQVWPDVLPPAPLPAVGPSAQRPGTGLVEPKDWFGFTRAFPNQVGDVLGELRRQGLGDPGEIQDILCLKGSPETVWDVLVYVRGDVEIDRALAEQIEGKVSGVKFHIQSLPTLDVLNDPAIVFQQGWDANSEWKLERRIPAHVHVSHLPRELGDAKAAIKKISPPAVAAVALNGQLLLRKIAFPITSLKVFQVTFDDDEGNRVIAFFV
ncbi:MAG: hypothetical protein HYS41_04340 [Candidatus Omnitrophica bacterium]|nr:hypothetical protein [Candidatus Omnitrophota bacterium]